tara:strand:+ start:217 stop:939 length:723 start_codon:yes stop_codon:yes gene_type:complete
MTETEIEKLESTYLNTIKSLIVGNLNNILRNLDSMNNISEYWQNISTDEGFDTGAERIIYSVLQRGGDLGEPNSSPVGSDLMFESSDAFIHIDLKTCQPQNNLRDHWETPVGRNQNSYKYDMIVNKTPRAYKPHLPTYYSEKPTLTYFITILYSKNSNLEFKVANINVGCMPNGSLKNIYSTSPLGPGKNVGQARFMMAKCFEFKKLNNEKRIKIIYENLEILDQSQAMKLEEKLLSLIR